VTYRYLLEGPELRVIEEAVIIDDETVWHKRVSSFGSDNGVVVPTRMRIYDKGGEMQVNLSRFSINTNIGADDLSFDIPPTAKRLPY
jgi:hypothetical protein